MSDIVFDAGALIAFEKNDRDILAVVAVVVARSATITIPAGVVAQVWRDGRRQARLSRLLGTRYVVIEPLDDARARAAGQLCGVTGTRDIVDASVVLSAMARGDTVFTSDAGDLRRLAPRLRIENV